MRLKIFTYLLKDGLNDDELSMEKKTEMDEFVDTIVSHVTNKTSQLKGKDGQLCFHPSIII